MNQFKESWHFLLNNFQYLIVLVIPVLAVDIAVAMIVAPLEGMSQPEDILAYFEGNSSLFFVGPLSLIIGIAYVGGIYKGFDSITGSNYVKPLDALLLALKKFFPLLGAVILSTILIMLGFLLLILPGIYLMGRFSLYGCYIMLENKGAMEALRLSWDNTDEHGGKLFKFTLTFLALLMISTLIVNSLIDTGILNIAILASLEYLFMIPLAYIYFTLYKSFKTSQD